MIKAVIFDMDGVMIDSEPLWEKTEKIMMARKGLVYNPVYREKIVGLGQKESAILLKKTFSLNEDIEDIIDQRISVLLDIYDRELSLVTGLTELLDSVSKSALKVALASSSPLRVIEFVLCKFDLNKYFDLVVSGDMVEHGKPSPDIYNYTAESLGLECDECVVIEDSIRRSIMVLRKSLDSTQVRFVLERGNLVLKGQEFTTSLLAHEFFICVT